MAARSVWYIIFMLIATVGIGPALAETQAELEFDRIFGEQLWKVRRTPSRLDDVEFAETLLTEASTGKRPVAVNVLCLEHAYDLAAMLPPGYETAIAAAEKLAELVPDRRVEALGKLAHVRLRQYATSLGRDKARAGEQLIETLLTLADLEVRAGNYREAAGHTRQALSTASAIKSDRVDEITKKLQELAVMERIDRQIEQFETRLQENPGDLMLRQKLIKLYVVEKNNPRRAARFLNTIVADSLREKVTLAASHPRTLEETQHYDLAGWYVALPEDASRIGQVNCLRRAKAHYQYFLSTHSQQDFLRDKALKAVEDINAKLAELDPEPNPYKNWSDVLDRASADIKTAVGAWTKSDGQLSVKAGRGLNRLDLPAGVTGAYKMHSTFSVGRDGGTVVFMLPVGDGETTVSIGEGRGGRALFLDATTGRGGRVGQRIRPLQAGKDHQLDVLADIDGDQAMVTVTLDGQKVLEWKGKQSSLKRRKGFQGTPAKGMSVGSFRTDATFKDLRVKVLSGKQVEIKTPKK